MTVSNWVLTLLLLTAISCLDCNATIGNYISPYSLGQQDELNDTLASICPNIIIQDYEDQIDSVTYAIHNISVKCAFFDAKQTAEFGNNSIMITGGMVEFMVDFNFTITKAGEEETGSAYTSVAVQAPNFTKNLTYVKQYIWVLSDNFTGKIVMPKELKIKRWTKKPASEGQCKEVEAALNTGENSVLAQLQKQVNANLTATLNTTLREEKVFNATTIYTFQHQTKGNLQIKYQNYPYKTVVDPKMGLILEYLSIIDGESTTDCTSDIPKQPMPYEIYGGIQTVHHVDLYRQTLHYVLKQRWMDVTLDSSWESVSFQFYVGDLYNIVPKVRTLGARTRLGGACNASDTYNSFKRYGINMYLVSVNYSCEIHSEVETKLMTFDAEVNFVIRLGLTYENLEVRIQNASAVPTFKASGEFVVEDKDLATFKINQVLGTIREQKTFGDGFPTWPRDLPHVEVLANYTLLYDSSHIPHDIEV